MKKIFFHSPCSYIFRHKALIKLGVFNTQYIQVSQTVQNQDTLTRKLAPFDKIRDHNEKILITMDYETGSRNGVKQMNAVDWLLNKR